MTLAPGVSQLQYPNCVCPHVAQAPARHERLRFAVSRSAEPSASWPRQGTGVWGGSGGLAVGSPGRARTGEAGPHLVATATLQRRTPGTRRLLSLTQREVNQVGRADQGDESILETPSQK